MPLLSASQSEIPLCVYGRQEISSEETLKGTTLLQLGICNGKAAIRSVECLSYTFLWLIEYIFFYLFIFF